MALVGVRVHVLLPELPVGLTPAVVRGWARGIVEAANSHLGVSLQAAIGPVAPRLSGAALSRREADRVPDAMARGGAAAEVASVPPCCHCPGSAMPS